MKKHPKLEKRRNSESYKTTMKVLDLIDEHQIIRETVGDEFLNDGLDDLEWNEEKE